MEDNTSADSSLEVLPLVASEPFVGRWNTLVSTTNWEKGRIISQWRESQEASGATATASSDETWARLVGGVTGQHVGRLRRVYQRFGSTYEQYAGLYWSHFFAASDWNDGEMWLEGAVQNRWSVSQMRHQRWDTLGRVAGEEPHAEDEVSSERDEDLEASAAREGLPPNLSGTYDQIPGPLHEGPDFGDEDSAGGASRSRNGDDDEHSSSLHRNGQSAELVQPFANLPELPADLHDALDHFKLSLLHHKTAGWQEISQSDALKVLDALKAMVLAPADENAEAPF